MARSKPGQSEQQRRYEDALRRGGMTGKQFRELGPYPPAGYSAASFWGTTVEAQINRAIEVAVAEGVHTIFIPEYMLPYNASLITYNSSVRLMVEGSTTDAITPEAYGAVGNGTADDTNALAALVAHVRAMGGGQEIVLSGIYTTTATLDFGVDCPGNTIRGLGWGWVTASAPNAQLKYTGSDPTVPILWFGKGCSYTTIEKVGFLNGGEGIRFRPKAGTFVGGDSLNNCKVEKCNFYNQGAAGIFIGFIFSDTTSDLDMSSFTINGCWMGGTTPVGVQANCSNNGYALKVEDCTIYGVIRGVYTQGFGDITIKNCLFGPNSTSYSVDTVSGHGFYYIETFYTECARAIQIRSWTGEGRQVVINGVQVNSSVSDFINPAIYVQPYTVFINVNVSRLSAGPIARIVTCDNGCTSIGESLDAFDGDSAVIHAYYKGRDNSTTGADLMRWMDQGGTTKLAAIEHYGDCYFTGGFRQDIAGWSQVTTVAASQTEVALVDAVAARGRVMVRAGSIYGIGLNCSTARSAGTLTVLAQKSTDGGATWANLHANCKAVLSTSVKGARAIFVKDTYTFAAGDMLRAVVTTDSGWLPTGNNLDVSLEVEV